MSKTETEILQHGLAQSQEVQQQLQTLINSLRPLFDRADFAEQLAEAESYLYDAADALSDFEDDCQQCLDAWQEAQS